jgi:putative DNA primase/helicase
MAAKLTERDFESLAARWITPELAECAGLYRVTSAEGAQLVGRNGAGDYSGIAIPNVLPGQMRAREYRLRRDCPELEPKPEGGTRETGKYLHPPGSGNLLYFPPGTSSDLLQDAELPVAVVEGEFKTLALDRLANHQAEAPRWLSVGILGCWNWRGKVGKTAGPNGGRADVKGTIPDFDRVLWQGRTVYLGPDTNVNGNESVKAAWRELGKELERRGAHTATVEIPPEPGVNGIDDFLALHGPEVGLELFETAKPRNVSRDYHLTDLGNAHRLVARHGQNLLFIPAWKSWYVWDGRRWKQDDVLKAQSLTKETVKSLYADAAALQDDAERKKLVSFALASESVQKISAMLQLARSQVAAPPEEFDQDPDLVNCQNGTLHLPSGELRPHRRDDRITKSLAFAYNAESQCPCWLAFLTEIMSGGKGPEGRPCRMIAYLQRAIGYSLTGRTIEKTVFICYGSGSNGKTTLLSVLLHVLEEYAVTIQVDSLMSGRFDRSSNAQADLADLRGARFAMTSETGEGQRLSEALLKRITQGMGKIRAVRKYENPISFPETHKLWMDANHRPTVRDDGAAIWDRLHLIPFEIVIPKGKQDPALPEKLRAEAEGILAWAVEGARRWYAEGLQKPPEVAVATKQWREESDVLETFFSEKCIRDKSATVRKDLLYQVYHEWAEKAGERVETKRTVGRKLKDRGFDEIRLGEGGYEHWVGIGILDQAER